MKTRVDEKTIENAIAALKREGYKNGGHTLRLDTEEKHNLFIPQVEGLWQCALDRRIRPWYFEIPQESKETFYNIFDESARNDVSTIKCGFGILAVGLGIVIVGGVMHNANPSAATVMTSIGAAAPFVAMEIGRASCRERVYVLV